MNADDAMHRLVEVIRRKLLAPATERSFMRYCEYLEGLPFHLPSEQKPERFRTALAGKGVAASTQNQVLSATIFSRQGGFSNPCERRHPCDYREPTGGN